MTQEQRNRPINHTNLFCSYSRFWWGKLWHFPDCRLTNPQSILLSSGTTRGRRNMFSHSECFRLHDKPLSFSSPCQPGYLKRTAGASTKAQDGLTFRFQGIKIKEAQRTKERTPLVMECMCVFACRCFHPSCRCVCLLPCWESDGLAREQITRHVRYKWHRTFPTGPLILTEWEQQDNSRCFHSAVRGRPVRAYRGYKSSWPGDEG